MEDTSKTKKINNQHLHEKCLQETGVSYYKIIDMRKKLKALGYPDTQELTYTDVFELFKYEHKKQTGADFNYQKFSHNCVHVTKNYYTTQEPVLNRELTKEEQELLEIEGVAEVNYRYTRNYHNFCGIIHVEDAIYCGETSED